MNLKPILKWAGGKTQILPEITKVIKKYKLNGHRYFEPFVGAGSVFMQLAHDNIFINDYNEELINIYIQIKDNPQQLIELLKEHEQKHSKEYFYAVRSWDRSDELKKKNNLERAARTIYLNRTCYNGLYRVNANGEFNVPYGRYKKPNIVQEEKIKELNKYLNSADLTITCGDFEQAVTFAKQGDVVYFDPPYDYDTTGFSNYTEIGFSHKDLNRLKSACDKLIEKGCHIILSNNNTKYVNELFSGTRYVIKKITARRMINCDGEKRIDAKEVIIYDR